MTRETRIALLVGVAFIVLFGLVLGERSLRISRRPQRYRPPPAQVEPQPGPEVITAAFQRDDDRPVLSPKPVPPPAAPSGPAVAADAHAPADPQPRPNPHPAGNAPVARNQSSQPPRAVVPPQTRQRAADPPARVVIYKVQPGDTLIRIARKVYGRERESEYRRIYEVNRDRLKDAGTVMPGQELLIPPLAHAPELATPAAPGRAKARYSEVTLEALAKRFRTVRVYTVRPNDTLTGIARRVMGDDSKKTVRKLFEANRDRIQNPHELPVGLKLRIPS